MMSLESEYSHCVTVLVNASSQQAFDYLADPIALGDWSIGCMNVEPTGQIDVYTGRSLLSGTQTWFRIDARRELMLVDYHTGTPGRLIPRISARIIGARVCELREGQCYISLTAWRTSTMSDERWQFLCATHELEIQQIKRNIERGTKPGDAQDDTWP